MNWLWGQVPEGVGSHDLEVHLCFVDNVVKSVDLEAGLELLSDAERLRVDNMLSPVDRVLRAARFARRRQLLAEYLGIDPFNVKVTYDERGRPETSGDCRFSCSYAGEVFVMALTRGRDIVVDVEKIRNFAEGKLLTRHLSALEIGTLKTMPEHDAVFAASRIWTRKEAYAKARGIGFSLEPRDIVVATSPHPLNWSGRPHGDEHPWCLQDIDGLATDIVITLAVPTYYPSTCLSVSVRRVQ